MVVSEKVGIFPTGVSSNYRNTTQSAIFLCGHSVPLSLSIFVRSEAMKPKNLSTTGTIAQQFGVHRDTVSYAIRRAGLKPVGIAGCARLFDETAVKLVGKYLAMSEQRKNWAK